MKAKYLINYKYMHVSQMLQPMERSIILELDYPEISDHDINQIITERDMIPHTLASIVLTDITLITHAPHQ